MKFRKLFESTLCEAGEDFGFTDEEKSDPYNMGISAAYDDLLMQHEDGTENVNDIDWDEAQRAFDESAGECAGDDEWQNAISDYMDGDGNIDWDAIQEKVNSLNG